MKYNLYTFYSSKLIWTETENIKDALKNFRERLNLDHNGYYHPEMIYNFKYPMYVVTKENEKKEYIIGYETDKLTNKIICN